MSVGPSGPTTARTVAGPAVLAVAAAAMLAWTWRTWPDPLVDYGREVYLAWRVSEGATLYADLAHHNGPLSVYVNALVFRLVGPGILPLALANGLLAAACLALLYGMLVRLADRTAATLAGLAFVVVFLCPRYLAIGNYTWLCPYSHELPHGVLCAVAALWCLDRRRRTGRDGWTTLAGGALGLALLTKSEVVVAAGLAVATGLVLLLVDERADARRAVALAGRFAIGLLAPLGVTALWFLRALPPGEVLAWPLGYWWTTARPEFAAMPIYRESLGIDHPVRNLAEIAKVALVSSGLLAPGIVEAVALRRRPWRPALGIVLGVATAVAYWALVPAAAWLYAALPLPFVMAGLAVASMRAWWGARADEPRAERLALRTSLVVLALGLLAKMPLAARVHHYGFALAMPGMLLLVVALVAWGPAWVTRRGGEGRALRAVAVGIVVAGLAGHLAFMRGPLARQTEVLGEGVDAIYGDERVRVLREALAEIRRRVGPGRTLTVLPEGILLDYLARRVTEPGYTAYTRLNVLLYGEERMVREFDARPPDFVLLVTRRFDQEGARIFGRDYATRLMALVERDYRPVWGTGGSPTEEGPFGVRLLERVSAAGASDGP